MGRRRSADPDRTTAGRGALRAPTSAGPARPRRACAARRSGPCRRRGRGPAQSGACRIWSGSASAIASRAQAESSSWSSTTYSLRSSSASPGSFAWYSRASMWTSCDRVLEAAHARAVQPHVEREPEIEPGRRLGNGQVALDLVRHRQVALAAELERLELDRDGVALLLPGAKAEASERVAGHRPPLEVAVVVFRLSAAPFPWGRRPRRPSPASARAAARGRA